MDTSFEVIHELPRAESFTPLSEHESQTPSSFFTGNPILYRHISGAQALLENQHKLLDVFERDPPPSNTTTNGNTEPDSKPVNGTSHTSQTISGLEVFVTSERFILFQIAKSVGVAIPYPSISLHAIQRLAASGSSGESEGPQGLYMQIESGPASYDEQDTIELTISTSEGQSIQDLYAAVSTCSNLHPDQAAGSDNEQDGSEGAEDRIMFEGNVGYESQVIIPGSGDGSLPPPFPGSGGWITAENVGEYFDEEGNWRAGLGPGAGTVRGRDDEDEGERPAQEHVAGEHIEGGENDDETKWRRTN